MTTTKFVESFHKIPSLHAYRVRCCKPNCHCKSGEGHGPYWYLRWREGTLQRRRYLRLSEVEEVRAVIESRHAEDRGWRMAMAEAEAHHREVKRWLRSLNA